MGGHGWRVFEDAIRSARVENAYLALVRAKLVKALRIRASPSDRRHSRKESSPNSTRSRPTTRSSRDKGRSIKNMGALFLVVRPHLDTEWRCGRFQLGNEGGQTWVRRVPFGRAKR